MPGLFFYPNTIIFTLLQAPISFTDSNKCFIFPGGLSEILPYIPKPTQPHTHQNYPATHQNYPAFLSPKFHGIKITRFPKSASSNPPAHGLSRVILMPSRVKVMVEQGKSDAGIKFSSVQKTDENLPI